MPIISLDSSLRRRAQQGQTAAEAGLGGRYPYPTIMLVDDDAAVQESVRRVLVGENLNVLVASDGSEALRLLEQHEPDLLITDLCMAGIDGWDLLFHEHRVRPELPIFVTTALPPRDTSGADKFAAAFFQKPLDFDALLVAIRQHVRPPAPGHPVRRT